MDNAALVVVEPVDAGRVQFLYEPPEEYDFRISFTIPQEKDCIVQIGYCAGHQFDYPIGGTRNTFAGFETVDGKEGNNNQTTKKRNHWLTSGHRYTSVVKVRKSGLEAYLDGELVTRLQTDYSDMNVRGPWRLPRGNVIGIGASDQTVRFDAVEVIEITGRGKMLTQ